MKKLFKKKYIQKKINLFKKIITKKLFKNKINSNKKLILLLLILFLIFISISNIKKYNNFTIFGNGPIIGIDISNHQGEIDWDKISHYKINFIFIKATEGISYKDPFFKTNWEKASEKKFLKGAYHFFQTGTPGIPQAENFIKIVPFEKNTLPPVLDLEIINGNRYSVIQEIKNFLIILEKYYKKKPIIYVNRTSYETYIRGIFNEYLIWFADYAPKPFYGKEIWIFWQYMEKGKLEGINGYVDLNLFKGTKHDLLKLVK